MPHHAFSRLSRALLALLAATGCVSEPLTLEDTQRIPPFIIVEKTEPPPWVFKRLTASEGTSQSFHVPFFSEDVGVSVQGLVYVDVLPGDTRPEAEQRTGLATDDSAPDNIEESSPGTFGVERSIDFEITDFTPGCHAVSALLTHASNFDPDSADTILNKNLVARVVWWFDVQGTAGVQLADCPTLGIEPVPAE